MLFKEHGALIRVPRPKVDWWLLAAGGGEGWGVLANGFRDSFGGDEISEN